MKNSDSYNLFLLLLSVSSSSLVQGCIRLTAPPPPPRPTPPTISTQAPTLPPIDSTTRAPYKLVEIPCINETLQAFYCLHGGICLQNHWDFSNFSLSDPYCKCHHHFVGKRCHDRYIDPTLFGTVVGIPIVLVLIAIAAIAVIAHRKHVISRRIGKGMKRVSCHDEGDPEQESSHFQENGGNDSTENGQKFLSMNQIQIKVTDHDQNLETEPKIDSISDRGDSEGSEKNNGHKIG